MTERSNFVESLKTLAASRLSPGHPTPEALLAYHLGTLQEDHREALQDHLASCSDCARAVLDMARFPAVECRTGVTDPATPGPSEIAEIQRRAGLGRRPEKPRFLGTLFPVRYLAAALGLVCLVLVWRLEVLDSRLAEARSALARLEAGSTGRPILEHSFEILSLQPIGTGEVRGPDEPAVVVRGPVPVILNAYLPERGPYSVELVDASDRVWRTWSGLEPTSRKNLTVLLSPAPWPPGRYELRIREPGAEPGSPLARFAITIEP